MKSSADWLHDSAPDDPRLQRAANEYLAALEAGQRPNRQEFAARYPELAGILEPYLQTLDLIHPGNVKSPSLSRPLADEVQPPEPLGDFRIIGKIGHGGMGTVYEAVQLSLGRRVALKILHFAAALDEKQLQRFKNEAQAAAQLHHTNIVPVYGVGCERGVHYYAMQLIEGQNLSDLIQQLRSHIPTKGAKPKEEKIPASAITAVAAEVSTQRGTRGKAFYPQAARLMVQAAEALEYAHQLGVIHRDVKPSNLLVDGRGNLWVADFGLAQFNTGAGLTRTGELIGTLRYMSPEQAGGKGVPFDHRTDVYSLGATLYELLTLEPIFPGDDYHRLLRHIFNDEPRPLRAIDPSVPAELETIVLKAVSKNAIDRYATAQELADDLKRFVDHRPIRARRPTLIQRLRKWTRRHPSVVPAAVILLIIITAGSLVSAGLIHAEKQKTDQAYQRERQRAEEAEAQFQLARRSVDEMIRTSQEELADSPHLERLRRRLLMSALVYYQELIDGRRDDPAAQEELRETKRSVEKILADLTILEGVGNLHLLSQTAVQDDLELSPEQRLKITDLSDRLMAQGMELFRRFGQLSAEERQTRFLDQARADDAAMNAVLTRSQVSRLRQIALQSQGLAAFRDPVVVDALKLTGEQRKKIRAIESDQFFSSIEGMRPGASPEDFRKSFDQKRLVTLDRVRKLLTPEQEQTWNTLSGKPFQGALPFLFRPGPPGPPPPPPR